MNNKLKNIIKISVIWYSIPIVLCSILALLDGFYIFKNNIPSFFVGTIFIPLVCIACFSPTIFLLYFICKKIKSKEWKIITIAFSIPVTNLVYYYIAMFLDHHINNIRYMVSYPMVLGIFSILTLFFVFIGTLCTPKSLLPMKKDFLITELLMFAFGCILIGFIATIDKKFVNTKTALLQDLAIEKIIN